jgi:hypothetical protein
VPILAVEVLKSAAVPSTSSEPGGLVTVVVERDGQEGGG